MVDGHCYYLEIVGMTYEEAQANCASKFLNSGKLFEPLSLQVNGLVWEEFYDTIDSNPRGGPWIGVTDHGGGYGAGWFKYASSGSEVSFTIPWLNPGSGSTFSPECIILWTEGKWDPTYCTNYQKSICEQ